MDNVPYDTNASQQQINAVGLISGSLKTAIEKEKNKMSDEFILMACKSFRRYVDAIIKKYNAHINLLFCVYLLILLFIF